MASWEAVTALVGVAGALGASVSALVRQSKVTGRHEEHMDQLDKTVQGHTETLKEHASQLSDGAGNFKVIDSKLDNLAKLVEKVDERLQRHCEERNAK